MADSARILAQLNQSKIKKDDPALYDAIKSLLADTREIQQTVGISGGSSGSGSSPGGSGITELTGDVAAGPGTGSVVATIQPSAVIGTKIANSAVTYAKIQDVSATARILARKTAGSGVVEEATIEDVLNFIASLAQGDILYRNATQFVRLPAGTNKQFLQTAGSSANPTWASGIVLLEQHTATSSASLDFTTSITSLFDEYIIEFVSIIPANNTTDLWMRMSTNGGSSYDSGNNYSYESWLWRAAASGQAGATAQAQILVNSGTTLNSSTSWGFNGHIRLFSPLSATANKQLLGQTGFFSSGSLRVGTNLHASYESTTAVNAFQFLISSGNIASGTIRVYGVGK